MANRIVLTLPACSSSLAAQPGQPSRSPELDQLSFLVGEWSATGENFPEAFGALAGRTAGVLQSGWAVRDVWLLTQFSTSEGEGPPYTVHVYVTWDPEGRQYVAYALNNFAPVALAYRGEWSDERTLVFRGHLDPSGQRLQRVSYTSLPDGNVHFQVQSSQDGGATFERHSELTWTRR